MRSKKEFKRISVDKELHERLIQDRDHFENVIGGGRWSISDTIREYLKIIHMFKEMNRIKQDESNQKNDGDENGKNK